MSKDFSQGDSPDHQQGGSPEQALARWRLILGRFAEEGLPGALDGRSRRMDQALDFLYGREYRGRGRRADSDRQGGDGPSMLNVPAWLREVRELFPRETAEVVERHALERYGMTELVTDPLIMERMEPNMALLRAVLTFKSMMSGAVLETARRVVRRVVEDLRRRLEGDVRRVLWGKLNRFQHSPLRVAQNFDWRRTLRANLRHYDRERGRLLAERIHFFARVERRLPWHVILAVDQSGSMLDSVIHSAVIAGILAGLPSLRVSLVVFDTAIVDLSGYVDDPTEALLSVQLGGGTAVINLTLDQAGGQAAAPPPVLDQPGPQASDDAGDEQPEAKGLEGDRPAESGVARLLGAALALLEQIAEQGGSRADAEGQLRDLAARLRQIGVATCADRLDAMADQRAALRHSAAPDPRQAAHALLRAAYVQRLARDQLSLTQTLAALA